MNLLVMNLFIAMLKKTAKSDWVSGKKEVIFCSDIWICQNIDIP